MSTPRIVQTVKTLDKGSDRDIQVGITLPKDSKYMYMVPVYHNASSREIVADFYMKSSNLIPPSECFSVTVDKQYVLIIVQTLTKDTVSLYVIDFTATDKKINEFIIADVPKKVKASADRLSTL